MTHRMKIEAYNIIHAQSAKCNYIIGKQNSGTLTCVLVERSTIILSLSRRVHCIGYKNISSYTCGIEASTILYAHMCILEYKEI